MSTATKTRPAWEYKLNAFDVAAREVATCRCSGAKSCPHVEAYIVARRELIEFLDSRNPE